LTPFLAQKRAIVRRDGDIFPESLQFDYDGPLASIIHKYSPFCGASDASCVSARRVANILLCDFELQYLTDQPKNRRQNERPKRLPPAAPRCTRSFSPR
jgi:hypothetical protein